MSHVTWTGSTTRLLAVVALVGTALAACTLGPPPPPPRALLVGSYNGHPGQYSSIQAAVRDARPGDWVLVGPGDYHETADHQSPPTAEQLEAGANGGVLVTTNNIHIRGMDRNGVVVDGALPSASGTCSADPAAQDLGETRADGQRTGRNGIVVYKASGVSVDNLTVCNFLSGANDSGNEIWWNGGSDTGTLGAVSYSGRYLTATSTYFADEHTAAAYGIFSSDITGPAFWDHTYASNFNDSGMYIGACQRLCSVIVDHARMEYNALGYSGTNSGGSILIEHSEFANNQDGFDTNTQIGGDPPAPQDGSCADGGTSPITGTTSCWVFRNNWVHDNNNTTVPAAGSASAGPLGTGMTVSGGRNNTVTDNLFMNNNAWGLLVVPYPDDGNPSMGQSCAQLNGTQVQGLGCVLESSGNHVLNNFFVGNGGFGNPTNGDLGQIVLVGGQPANCYAGNLTPHGTTPTDLEQTQPRCGGTAAANTGGDLLGQVLCDTGFGTCPPGSNYPARGPVQMQPLPGDLATMPDPCTGVPANPWC